MDNVLLEILFIIILILANGLFAMAEMAIVSSRKVRLQQRAEEGDAGARSALQLLQAPNQFLSTIQIGITMIGILAGAIGGTTIARKLAVVLGQIDFLASYSQAIAVGIVVVIITFMSVVIGELAPKRLALSHAERIAAFAAPLMHFLSRIAAPFVRALGFSTELVLRLFGFRSSSELPVTEEEVKIMIEQGTQVGVFERSEQELIERVLRLDDRPVETLMTPRPDVIWIDMNQPFDDLCNTIIKSGFATFPVAEDDLDHIVGLVLAKDLLAQSLINKQIDVKLVTYPALFVPESMSALETLERLKEGHAHTALVIDEYGVFQGLVTINDILEAIVGEIPAWRSSHEPEIVRREDGSYLMDGKLLIEDLKERLGLEGLPEEESGFYQTLGGMIMSHMKRVPRAGDHFDWAGWRFEVVDMDDRRVDKVLVMPLKSIDSNHKDQPGR